MADSGTIAFYRRKYSEYSDQLRDCKRKQRTLVILRLAGFILMVSVPLIFVPGRPLQAAGLFVLFLTLFLLLVKRFAKIEKRSRYLACLLEVNQNEIEALRGNLKSFNDGSDYTDTGHPYSHDLDIFGPGSLFNYINRCSTSGGRDTLAGMLSEPDMEAGVIRRRQKAFEELAGKPAFCQEFMATGKLYGEDPHERHLLLGYINTPSWFTANGFLVAASKILPAITLLTMVMVIAGRVAVTWFFLPFLLQLVLTGMLLKRVNEVHNTVTQKLNILKKQGNLLHIIESARVKAPLLKSLQRCLKSEGTPPSGHIRGLARLAGAFDNRLNPVAAIVLNGLLLWDINCVLKLEAWNRRHRKNVPVWLDAICRMDAFISFSVFTFNNSGFVFPCQMENGPVIDTVALGHPLIPASERVCNDVRVDRGRFMIITGANMAGKSTLLRSAGVALVLAMNGAPVCAESFSFRISEIWSSMRTNDSLRKNESYFYAELLRLKRLMERIASGAEVFVLLDEILKGTNTEDKQKGSAALLDKMIGLGASGIVATHDLSLTWLEQKHPAKVFNKCFEIDIDGDKISFDYLLRNGITTKMNAMLLMKQMGLLDEV
jgi:hypothetical protein